MADQAQIELSDEAQQILRDLQTMPKWMLEAIAGALAAENQYTLDHIRKEYLSFSKSGGPGRLGASWVARN